MWIWWWVWRTRMTKRTRNFFDYICFCSCLQNDTTRWEMWQNGHDQIYRMRHDFFTLNGRPDSHANKKNKSLSELIKLISSNEHETLAEWGQIYRVTWKKKITKCRFFFLCFNLNRGFVTYKTRRSTQIGHPPPRWCFKQRRSILRTTRECHITTLLMGYLYTRGWALTAAVTGNSLEQWLLPPLPMILAPFQLCASANYIHLPAKFRTHSYF